MTRSSKAGTFTFSRAPSCSCNKAGAKPPARAQKRALKGAGMYEVSGTDQVKQRRQYFGQQTADHEGTQPGANPNGTRDLGTTFFHHHADSCDARYEERDDYHGDHGLNRGHLDIG